MESCHVNESRSVVEEPAAPPPPPPELLRAWTDTAPGSSSSVPPMPPRDAPPSIQPEISIGSPPVAPAVVVHDTPEYERGIVGRQSSYDFPVATFVRDLVRTSVNHIQHVAAVGSSASSAERRGTQRADALPLSVRSVPDLMPPPATSPTVVAPGRLPGQLSAPGQLSSQRSAPAVHHHHHHHHQSTHQQQEESFLSSRSGASTVLHENNNVDQSDPQEFLLVDGDLIAIPAGHHYEYHHRDGGGSGGREAYMQEEIERRLRSAAAASSHPSCQPKKVKRGARKILKFFKRGGGRKSGSKDASTTLAPTEVAENDSFREPPATIEAVTGLSGRSGLSSDQSLGPHVCSDRSVVASERPTSPPPTTTTATSPVRERQDTDESLFRRRGGRGAKKERGDKKPRGRWSRRGGAKEPPAPSSFLADSGDGGSQEVTHEQHLAQAGLSSPLMHSERAVGTLGGLMPAAAAEIGPLAASAPSSALLQHQFHLQRQAAGGLGVASMPPPPPAPFQQQEFSQGGSRTQSVTASYLGPADQFALALANQQQGEVLPDIAAESFVEMEDGGDVKQQAKQDVSEHEQFQGYYEAELLSTVPPESDIKVDKADAPDVESMLRRAVIETNTDLEVRDEMLSSVSSYATMSDRREAISARPDQLYVPLSEAVMAQAQPWQTVYNDTLKVVMVSAPCVDKSWLARKLRNSHRRSRKRTTLAVDVHYWRPPVSVPAVAGMPKDEEKPTSLKCSIWDVQGASVPAFACDDGDSSSRSNFGAHPGTQSLFFSAQSLYLLVWDLARHNTKTMRRQSLQRAQDSDSDDDSEDEDDDHDYQDDFVLEEANRQADRALHADISHRVLSWVDVIARRGPRSAILPVALIPDDMTEQEIKRRCNMMQNLLEEHVHRFSMDPIAPKLLAGTESVLCVNYGSGEGIHQLQETVMAIATDSSRSVFSHVGTPVPHGTVEVLESIQRFKEDHKLILLDHLLCDIGSFLEVDTIVQALHFLSSIGEILYFGTDEDDVLSRYIILSRKWMVSALSCILRNDLKRELSETRRFMNMQCIYSDAKFGENEVTRTLVTDTGSSVPLLSDEDANMLWHSMSFMREAADRHSELSETSAAAPSMFHFLERLLVNSGVFLPLGASHTNASLDRSQVFFVPSLLSQADPRDIWTYKSREGWMTTLCHSWLFRDGAPSSLMEHITVSLLRDLYHFSRTFQVVPPREPWQERARSVPIARTSFDRIYEEHDQQVLGRVKIHHVMCWKSTLLVKIGTIFADHESGELKESFVEIFVTVVDNSSTHSVASDVMRASMQRVVVSGKGQVGHHGRKLWKGGYRVILESVQASLSMYSNVDAQVICPACLAHSSPRIASTWGWDSVLAVAESGCTDVRCLRGHRVDCNLLCGRSALLKPAPLPDGTSQIRLGKPVSEMLPSVVVVGLWDSRHKVIRSVGSGFIVDKKLGLIVTAGHVLFKMDAGRDFGAPYFGIADARVVIGVIPDDDDDDGEERHIAVFRYFADIVADDIHNIDACVLRIRTRMETDVDDEGPGCADQPEKVLTATSLPQEQLRSLKLTKNFELEESVRLLGFNQGGEGIFEEGKHVNRFVDFAKGYICKKFKAALPDDSSNSDSSSEHVNFSPREEIVVMCSNIAGHSGGPCVNNDGKVVGILSRADPVERRRCYLVPATEIKTLVSKARMLCTRPARIKTQQTL